MNTQPIEESQETVQMSREEYIRQARESCLRNYYGDRMPSHEKAIEEYSKNRGYRVKTEDMVPWTEEMSSIIVPYNEERFTQGRNRKTDSEGRLLAMNVTKKLDANEINKRLQQESFGQDKENTIVFHGDVQSGFDDLNQMAVTEPLEENIPKTGDIIRMSGIDDSNKQGIDTDYVEEYKANYHNIESENYVTSIRNVDAEEYSRKGKLLSKDAKSFRWFAIRCACAFGLLVAIIIWDKTAKEIQTVSARNVYEKMVSSDLALQLEEWLSISSKK